MSSLSIQLALLANPELNLSERQLVTRTIDLVYQDLISGHSCSKLGIIARELGLSALELQELLLKSNLAGEFVIGDHLIAARVLTIYHGEPDKLVYLSKYFAYEWSIARSIMRLNTTCPIKNELDYTNLLIRLEQIGSKHGLPNSEQLAAIKKSVTRQLSIITGGPGTGKTTTVALLLWLLIKLYADTNLNIRICAPTGKAANRVMSSINESINRFKNEQFELDYSIFDRLLAENANFTTIHKLLGYQPNSIYFRHDTNSPLEADILIIDESSMIGLPLFSKLLAAVDPEKTRHIIFLGDKNQLSSVEEGYVFASLVNHGISFGTGLKPETAFFQPDLFSQGFTGESSLWLSQLKHSNRNFGDVSTLAQAVLAENPELALNILQNSPQVTIRPVNIAVLMHELFAKDRALADYIRFISHKDYETYEISRLFAAFNRHTLLSIVNNGKFGIDNLNLLIEKKVRQLLATNSTWYNGRPVMILSNDYSLGVFNGDIGICQIRNEQAYIMFANNRELIPEVLPSHQPAYAMTIHKSQGSEYQEVSIVLPELSETANLASCELVYTAITRARSGLQVFAEPEVLQNAIQTKLERNSGLESMLKSYY